MTVSTIGSASRTYATIALWEAGCPANLVTAPDTWEGEMYNDSEFVVTTTTTISGITTDSTHNVQLRCATGQSFTDSSTTAALDYNVSNGVGIRMTTIDVLLLYNSAGYTKLTGLQFKHSGVGYSRALLLTDQPGARVEHCIFRGGGGPSLGRAAVRMAAGSATTEVLVNSLIIADSNAANGLVIYGFSANKTVSAVGCTVVKPTDFSGATGVAAQYGTGVEFKGSACFGFSAGTPFTGTFGGSSGYNCTDSATAPGSNNQVSKTYANQFENTTNASADFRAKTGGDLANNAIQFSETADLDIKKRARSVTTPTIGAWELISAADTYLMAARRHTFVNTVNY